ncbi:MULTISPECIES: YbaB/EbfC family nucleoid-associated protein [Nocardia]|uniref:YbaB/EbfC family nucleoid-associated protein n=1 Tax=Nocardia TaxID=1817 RepID=UPI001E4AAD1F|nr:MULTISPECIES: YbaB/EbfC family nucleoid-associated protein [Nocardia]UGT68818.1 YbaB/EbfC family nucleoid-associated protein [Nocardia gipuzkoensis]
MVNERLRADMATMLEGLGEQFRGIAELQKQRSLLTATVTACDKRIEVTVNADGVLIATRFADDVLDLSLEEIAENITAAVQAAAAEVAGRGRELMAPLLERRNALPKLSEIVEGAPDLGAMIPTAPAPPLTPPDPARWPVDDSGATGPRSVVADNDD